MKTLNDKIYKLPDNLEMRFMSNVYEGLLILLFCCPKYSTFSYHEVHFADIVGAITFYYDFFIVLRNVLH